MFVQEGFVAGALANGSEKPSGRLRPLIYDRDHCAERGRATFPVANLVHKSVRNRVPNIEMAVIGKRTNGVEDMKSVLSTD